MPSTEYCPECGEPLEADGLCVYCDAEDDDAEDELDFDEPEDAYEDYDDYEEDI